MKKTLYLAGILASMMFIGAACLHAADGVVKISLNLEMSGPMGESGKDGKQAADLVKKTVDAQGGIKIGRKHYALEIIPADNQGEKIIATDATMKAITQQQALAIVGPFTSNLALGMSEVANAYKTPMVTPWASSTKIVENKPYVFRLSLNTDIQVVVMARYAANAWKAKKAAVLYNETDSYSISIAKTMQTTFEELNGPGSVVAFVSFRNEDKDMSKQLEQIVKSQADFLYLPIGNASTIPAIVLQARMMGWTKPIAGSDGWSVASLGKQCGKDCEGAVFSANFVAGGAQGKAKQFIDAYQQAYQEQPGEAAALTYDALNMVVHAISTLDSLSGNLIEDRAKIKQQLSSIQAFEGVTGKISYKGSGEPIRCVLISTVEGGQFLQKETICL